MSEHGALMVTGASGTVGTVLLRAATSGWAGPVMAIGRRRPDAAVEHFVDADLADPAATDRACTTVAAVQPPVTGLVLAAGVDCRSTLAALTEAELQRAFAVNCASALRLLTAAVSATDATVLRAVVVSSDVVDQPQAGTLVYAATKAALDVAVQHASLDDSRLRVLLVRLPALGTPMIDVQDRRSAISRPPLPLLDEAAAAVADFLLGDKATDPVRIWTDA